MLGVQVIANALVNIDLLTRSWGARKEAPTAAPVEDEGQDREGSGG